MNQPVYSRNKIIGTLLASQSLLSAASILLFTVAGIEVVELAGGNAGWTGVPSTVLLVASAVVAYPIGRLMDAAGRRIGLSVGHLMGVIGALISAWAVIQHSLLIFLAGVFVLGLSRGSVELGRYAAADVSPPDRRGRAISLVVLGGTAGSLGGPTLISLADRLGPQLGLPENVAPWLMAALMFVVGALVTLLLLRPDPQIIARQLAVAQPDRRAARVDARSLATLFRDQRARTAIGAMVFSQVSMVIVMTITPLHMHDHQHGIGAISWVIMGHTLGMFGFSLFTGWLADKVGRTRTIFAGGLISTVACATAPLSTTVPWLGLTLFLLGLGWNFSFVAGSALLDDVLHAEEKGRVQGSADAMVKVASGVGSLSSGLLFSASSFALTSWLTVLAAIIPALLVVALAAQRQASEPALS